MVLKKNKKIKIILQKKLGGRGGELSGANNIVDHFYIAQASALGQTDSALVFDFERVSDCSI